MDSNCPTCGNPTNPCAGVSSVAWDAAISACMERLGVQKNQPLSVVLSEISAAICTLMDAAELSCSGVLVPGTYANIGFTGTDSTTLCDLIDSVNTRFGDILDADFDDCFGTASTLGDALEQTRAKLCTDLYTNDSWKFLPLAGNSNTALQTFILMKSGSNISWYNATLTGLPSITADTSGMQLAGGLDALTHVLPVTFGTPIKTPFASRVDYSILTAGTVTLDQDSLKPLYFIDKTTSTAVNLPSLAAIIIDRPTVTFTANVLGVIAGTSTIFPFAGDTVQLGASVLFHNIDTITLVGDKVSRNWRIVTRISV